MYTITISNEYGSNSFEYEEGEANEKMIKINDCLNSKLEFIKLTDGSSEITYTTDILLKSQITHKENPEVFFF
nr:hypothetical protein [uncultured Chryseobacterium sp.]